VTLLNRDTPPHPHPVADLSVRFNYISKPQEEKSLRLAFLKAITFVHLS